MHKLREDFELKYILEYLQFPKSTYMYWQKRFDRVNPDEKIEGKMLEIRENHPNKGYRGIYNELRSEGVIINKKKVQRLVQKMGLQVTAFTKKSRKHSTYKGTVGKVAPNRVNGRFKSSIPYQKIVTDTTEFKYYEVNDKGRLVIKKLYLDPYMDLYNREIISYSISKKPNAESIHKALDGALTITSSCKYRRTFHSDQGWAYQMKRYVKKLNKHKVFQSMSRKGRCLDNSVMENFFGIMKQEMYYGNVFYSFEELENAMKKYIKYYNEERKKTYLNWMSPVQFRLNYQQ